MSRFLIIKTSALGDIVQSFPVLSYLKARDPQCLIDWVVEEPFTSLVSAHPYLNKVFSVNTKQWRQSWWGKETRRQMKAVSSALQAHNYDAVFDLQGNLKSAWVLMRTQAIAKVGFGFKTVPEWPNYLFTNHRVNPPIGRTIREDYMAIVQDFFSDSTPFHAPGVQLRLTEQEDLELKSLIHRVQNKPLVLVFMGSNWSNKQVPLDHWVQLLKGVQVDAHILLMWGTEIERQAAHYVHKQLGGTSAVGERLSLPLLQNFIGHARCVFAVDSLPLHLCGSVGTPSIALFGPSSAIKYAPSGEQHQFFQGGCPYGRQFEKRCTILRTCPTGACMHGFDMKKILETFHHLITT